MTLQSSSEVLTVPRLDDLDTLGADALITTLDDRGVRCTVECLTDPKYPYRPLTTFSIAHSKEYLYIDFFVRCNFLRAVNYQTNTPVHEDSAVGAMLQPNPTDPTYYILTFNCIGTVAGSVVRSGGAPEPIDAAVLERIQRVASCGSRPFQELEGLFTWNILVAIPYDLLGIPADSSHLEIKGNFFKCATGTSQPHFLSWLPVEDNFPTFRCPDTLGRIILE